MRYPQTFLDDLKRQADIVRVVQDYVQLKKKGANWMACCPFHKEKTPSFSVDPVQGLFYCFGCGAGGDAIKLHMLATGDAGSDYLDVIVRRGREAEALLAIEDFVRAQQQMLGASGMKVQTNSAQPSLSTPARGTVP